MKTTDTYPIYELSNPHFRSTTIRTTNGQLLSGQFVQFKVVKGDVEYLYPSEKYCFLPEQNSDEFWNAYYKNNGEFRDFPAYIKLLSLSDIKKIVIEPALVVYT